MIIEILKGKGGKRSLATTHICWQDNQNQINKYHSLTDFSQYLQIPYVPVTYNIITSVR